MAEVIAAELEQLRLQSNLIHELNFDIMRQLCDVLDSGDVWIEIAPKMPGISQIDVEACRKFGESGMSPSMFLLRIWASKGYCIIDLYNLFAMCRLVRCMQLMRTEVNGRFHYLEDFCSSNTPRHVRPQSSNLATAGTCHTPLSARGHQSTQPAISRVGGASMMSSSTPTTQSKTSKEEDPILAGMRNTPSVAYSELMEATDNFDAKNIIGKGGYGVVYRGEWKQTPVAVKRLSTNVKRENSQRDEAERLKQSLQELNTLAMFRHDNILPVYGYSLEGPDGPCLVYQYMANGSLDDRLQCKKGSTPLTWKQKANIAKGSAMALHFLHTIARLPLIHGDVKPANILLDRHLEPKLGDFGLSREGVAEVDMDEKLAFIASHIKGTLAYLPPEFVSSKIFSTKLDVFAFGVVILEMATGLRPYVDSRRPAALVELVKDLDGKARAEMGDEEERVKRKMWDGAKDRKTPNLDEESDLSTFWTLWKTGVSCSKKDRFIRPSFKEIVEDLKIKE